MPRRFLSTILLATLVSGCGVLEIDVDVYKGPLANHEDVQTEQMAVMAVGAKPLLIRLRTLLGGEEWITNLRQKGVDDQKYIPQISSGELEDQGAIFVNDILGLYEDKGDQEIAKIVANGTEVYLKLAKAQRNLLYEKPNKEDQALADAISQALADTLSTDSASKIRSYSDIEDEATIDTETIFRVIYRDFFTPKKKKRLPQCINKIFEYLVADKKNYKIEDCKDSRKEGHDYELSSLDAYTPLTNPETVSNHADVVIPNASSETKKNFIDRTTTIAKSYFSGRDAVRRLWEISLEAVEYITSVDFEAHSPAKDSKDQLITLASKIVSILSQPQHIAFAVADDSPILAEVVGLRSLLIKNLPSRNPDVFWTEARTDEWQGREFDIASDSVRRALIDEPLLTMRWLRIADRSLSHYAMEQKGQEKIGFENNHFSVAELRDYGLSRGPVISGEQRAKLENIPDLTASIATVAGGAFAKGRLPEGIETLIEDYLEAAERGRSAKPGSNERQAVSVALRKLRDALVRFAEKILFVANNEPLLRDDKNTGLFGIGESISTRDRYTLVLQAVGNSILIQADELSQREAHDERIKDRAPIELAALRQTFSMSPIEVYLDLLSALRIEAKGAAEEHSAAAAALTRVTDYPPKGGGTSGGVTGGGGSSPPKPTLLVHADSVLRTAGETKTTAQGDLDDISDSLKPITDAYLTLFGNDGVVDSAEIAEIREDREAIIEKVMGPEDFASEQKIVAEIIEWLEEQRNGSSALVLKLNPSRFDRLEHAKSYFVDHKNNFLSEPTAKREISLENVHKKVEKHYGQAELIIAEAESALKKASDRVAELERAIRRFEQSRSAKVKLDNAVSEIGSRQIEILTGMDPTDLGVSPRSVYARIRKVLNDDLSAASSGSGSGNGNVTTLGNAIEIMGGRNPPPESNRIRVPGIRPGENAQGVLDRLIAALRHEHILAVSEAGTKSTRAKYLLDAIKAAYDHRSGMAFIRPSIAYLRSSYASTSLQADPGLGWQNMLFRHSLRSLPGGSLFENARESDRLKIMSEIDKQFWQNINSVRVSGAGQTNFVVAKDDIGNWYVKGYSADTQDIIKAATSLAKFNIGSQLGTNLLDGGDGTEGAATGTRLERVFERRKNEYDGATAKELGKVQTALGDGDDGLAKRLETAWKSDPGLMPTLEAAKFHLAGGRNEIEDADASTGVRVARGLMAVRRFRSALDRDLNAKMKADPDNVLKYQAAQTNVKSLVGLFLDDHLERRLTSVNDFKNAITIIGEAINEGASPSEAPAGTSASAAPPGGVQ